LLKLVQKFVITFLWKQKILVLWGDLSHVLHQKMIFPREVRQFDFLASFYPRLLLFVIREACEVALEAFVVLLEEVSVDETTVWGLDLASDLSRENIS